MGLGKVNVQGGGSGGEASAIPYDNSTSGLNAENVQDAITELALAGHLIDTVPSPVASLPYNGGSQQPTWSGYDSGKLEIGGDVSGTNVGEYTATFTPKTGYAWSDGTTAAKSVNWYITVAKLTVPAQSGTLTYTGSSQTPSWDSNYDSAKMTLGGTTSGTNATSYNATFDLIDKTNYQWSDGTTTSKSVTWRIGKATPTVTAPTAKSGLKYNGSAQTLINAGSTTGGTLQYSKDNITFGTALPSATDVGSYTIYYKVVGNDNYNSVATASIQASIAQGIGSLSLNKSSLTLDVSSLTGTITATGTGTITAESSNTNIATVAVNGSTITVTGVAKGNATITVHCAGNTNYSAPADKTCSVTVDLPSSTLADNTPAQIKAVAAAGNGSSYWSVGDKIGIKVNGSFGGLSYNDTVYAFIIGFNHNQSVEGKGIDFQFGKTSGGTDIAWVQSYGSTGTGFCMNTSNTNSGGWSSSYMRSTICAAFLNALPSAWQSVIASATKYSDNTGGGNDTASYVTSTSDKIWLLSEFEVQGSRSYANSAEKNKQQQYAYYANGNSKIKYQHTSTGSACDWWLRSVHATDTTTFCCVNTAGSAYFNGAYYSIGFAPGFKVA